MRGPAAPVIAKSTADNIEPTDPKKAAIKPSTNTNSNSSKLNLKQLDGLKGYSDGRRQVYIGTPI